MRIPLVSDVNELGRDSSKFLIFQVFNVISWQSLIGPVLVLFARTIGMPASWVGFLMSFLPLSMVLIVFNVPLVTYYGPKRTMFTGWLIRNIVVSAVFFMPLVTKWWGMHAGWYVLMGATLAFCVTRALGVGGWFPWLHEIVPADERATFFGAEASVVQLVNIGVIVSQALVLESNPTMTHFLLINAAGVAAGLISLVWMARLAGGEGIGQRVSMWASLRAYRTALRNTEFMWFVGTASLCFSGCSWAGSALVLYMRDVLGMASQPIMFVMAIGSAGVLVTIRFWARFANHSGSGRAMYKALIGYAAAAAGLSAMTFFADLAHPILFMLPFTILTTVFASAHSLAAHRAMLNYVDEAGRIAFTNVWVFCTAITGGMTPIAAGFVIEHCPDWGFRICFLLAASVTFVGGFASLWVVRDSARYIYPSFTQLLNPILPIITLGRIAWITVGMHESNRTPDRDGAQAPAAK